MVALTAVLGVLAISASPEVDQPRQNFLFLALLVFLTVAVAAGITLRPARLSLEQLRAALGGLLAAGAVYFVATISPLLIGRHESWKVTPDPTGPRGTAAGSDPVAAPTS